MDDSRLIQRRLDELNQLNGQLEGDIQRSMEHLEANKEEIAEIAQAQEVLERLRGARRTSAKPRVPALATTTSCKKQSRQKETVGDLIFQVLEEENRGLRPAEIDKILRAKTGKDFHEKQVGKECWRLNQAGRLLKDDFTKKYSLPPDLGSDQTLNGRSLPNQPTAKGREAVPGGVT